jgi:hypothetical protein
MWSVPKYRVEFSGETYIEADSELEAECDAAFDCQPDNCHAELIEDVVPGEEVEDDIPY